MTTTGGIIYSSYRFEQYKGFKIHSIQLNQGRFYVISNEEKCVWGNYPYFDEYPTYVPQKGTIVHKSHTDIINSAKYLINRNLWDFTSDFDRELVAYKNIESFKKKEPIIW